LEAKREMGCAGNKEGEVMVGWVGKEKRENLFFFTNTNTIGIFY
jgi:hypothetical protein